VETSSNWNDHSRANASQKWRRQSAALGRHMTQAIVAEAQVRPGLKVLDVACGTGEPAISIASLLQGTGEVVATDISSEPLKIGQQRALERGLSNIRFVKADVHQLPFADSGFDRVTSRLGVMFFADLPRALREICRVLKPGGRVSMLAWGPIHQPYFESTIGTILRLLPSADIPTSGATMFRFGSAQKLSLALKSAGFQHVEERLAEVPWDWPGTPQDFWEYFQQVTAPFKPLFQSIPPERNEEIQNAVLEALTQRFDGSAVHFGAKVVLASATR
jgi:ubiquinone/menaquinone biosynthesis C-methylase UbiE